MNKTQMVRSVTENNLAMSNAAIKHAVKDRYQTVVETNLIISAIGSEKERSKNAEHAPELKAKAKDLIYAAGDYRNAQKILAIAGGEIR